MDMTMTKFSILAILIVLFMLFGVRQIFRGTLGILSKQSKHKELDMVHEKNGIPVIPRHLRQLNDDKTKNNDTTHHQANHQQDTSQKNEQVAHQDDDKAIIADIRPQVQTIENETALTASSDHSNSTAKIDNAQIDEDSKPEDFILVLDDTAENEPSKSQVIKPNNAFAHLEKATEVLIPRVQTVEEPAFTEQSPVIDKYLAEKELQDQNSPLKNSEININLTIQPLNPTLPIRGDVLLSLVDKYGLKFGILNMFHRYKKKEGKGILWFSMMAITDEGLVGFDINQLVHSHYQSLLLFLPLPHPEALQGFDAMISIAELMAQDLNAIVLDERNQEITLDVKMELRNRVETYQRDYSS